MDPQVCLFELLKAIKEKDREAAVEMAASLQTWLLRGGFMPEVLKTEYVDAVPSEVGYLVLKNRGCDPHA